MAAGAAAALRFTHCSLAVNDLDPAVRFYGEAFGCTVALYGLPLALKVAPV